jgi:hypothetical protein
LNKQKSAMRQRRKLTNLNSLRPTIGHFSPSRGA